MTTPSAAANAYASLARMASSSLAKANDAASGPSFGALLKSAIGSVIEAGHKSDLQARAMAAGKANMVDVVTAVAETEVAVETLVSIRDRMINAYQEIMRMPI